MTTSFHESNEMFNLFVIDIAYSIPTKGFNWESRLNLTNACPTKVAEINSQIGRQWIEERNILLSTISPGATINRRDEDKIR